MARLGETLGWSSNPFYKAFDANRSAIVSGFAGIGADPRNPAGGFSQGFANGMQLDQQRSDQQAEEEQRLAQINQTAQFLRAKGAEDLAAAVEGGMIDGSSAFNSWYQQQNAAGGDNLMSVGGHIYDTATGQWISPPENAGNHQNVSLTPQWGRDAQGNWVMLQTSSTGDLVQSAVPEGVVLADPRTIAQERAFGTGFGGAQADAAIAAPGDLASGETALDLINQIRTHPELNWATGFSAGVGGNAVPGTGRYDFQNLVDQAKSGAFLTAVQEMRGLGALSNAEGGAATQAITRMNTATTTEGFLKALEDYEAIVMRGIERARSRLPAGTAPAAGQTSSGLQWSIEP